MGEVMDGRLSPRWAEPTVNPENDVPSVRGRGRRSAPCGVREKGNAPPLRGRAVRDAKGRRQARLGKDDFCPGRCWSRTGPPAGTYSSFQTVPRGSLGLRGCEAAAQPAPELLRLACGPSLSTREWRQGGRRMGSEWGSGSAERCPGPASSAATCRGRSSNPAVASAVWPALGLAGWDPGGGSSPAQRQQHPSRRRAWAGQGGCGRSSWGLDIRRGLGRETGAPRP